jgi:molecular chaperone DnaK
VTFDIDANGILSVSAKDLSSGKQQQIKITAQSGLSEEEVKKAVREAELQADADKAKAEAVQAHNNLDNLIYQTEKVIKDAGTQLPEAEVKSANEAIAEARKVLENKGAPATELKAAFDKLQTVTHKLSSELYKKQGGQPGGDGTGGGGAGGGSTETEGANKGGDDVIDADYKDVN